MHEGLDPQKSRKFEKSKVFVKEMGLKFVEIGLKFAKLGLELLN